MSKQLPETAELQETVIKQFNLEDRDWLWFHLQKGDVEFKMGLSDIVQCLKFAETKGEIPKISSQWWDEMADLLYMDELRDLV